MSKKTDKENEEHVRKLRKIFDRKGDLYHIKHSLWTTLIALNGIAIGAYAIILSTNDNTDFAIPFIACVFFLAFDTCC
jgi:hypothetical protein